MTAEPEAVDAAIEERVTKKIDAINAEVKEAIEPIEQALKDERTPFLKLDISGAKTSYAMEGSFLYEDYEVMAHFSAQYRQGNQAIALNDVTLIFE